MALLAVIVAFSHPGYAFGRTGGSIMPFTVAIAASGNVTSSGVAPQTVKTVSKARLANLARVATAIHFTKLPALTQCPGTLPDIASQFVRVGGRTVRVHGTCVPGFNRLLTALNHAVAR